MSSKLPLDDPDKRAALFAALRRGASRDAACTEAGVRMASLRSRCDSDPAFRREVEDAEAASRGNGAVRSEWAALAAKMGEERAKEETRAAPVLPSSPSPRVEAGEDYNNEFTRVKAEARDTYGPGRLGLLKWIDARAQMMRPAVHAIEPLWIEAFAKYYDSGKLIMLARKGLRAGGSSSACPALVRCAAFGERHLDAGTIGVIPIMSATRDEADGRFVTIRSYLRAIGLTTPKKGKRGDDDDDFGGGEADEDGIVYAVPPGGISGTFRSKRSTSGGGVIAINDCHGHRIQFRILPAMVKHGVGYTGVAGFADESDLWANDPEHHVNPAEKIFDRISERFTTTYTMGAEDPGAEFLIFSASYSPDSAHKRAIEDVILSERGERPQGRDRVLDAGLAHLVRLGVEGARRDEWARRGLAAAIRSDDPRLLAPGDAMSPDLPAWVYNPTETIEKLYRFQKEDISKLLAMYGGRAAENAGMGKGATAREQIMGIAERRRERMQQEGRREMYGYRKPDGKATL